MQVNYMSAQMLAASGQAGQGMRPCNALVAEKTLSLVHVCNWPASCVLCEASAPVVVNRDPFLCFNLYLTLSWFCAAAPDSGSGTGGDTMKAMEAKAMAVAEQAKSEVAAKSKLLFVRSSDKEVADEVAREDNPDEIVLGEDDDEEEEKANVALKPARKLLLSIFWRKNNNNSFSVLLICLSIAHDHNTSQN